ncbi:type II toxin-antitoxin system PemI/MazE family antitoxin [Lentilactobacillus raoultii]|uniref:Type II toxin-antitoxin system PemI/MazE family antitoxin n=1 Tax=Lentilactobacillus raoultii TaxID=1987503 RepID=A0ABW3PE69_9LACO|nr:AbrB family transcriptional regulator [Lentilactobacillus raoultii]
MKARKQGNTLVLSIPKQFNVAEGTEFMSMQGSDGSLIYTPKAPNIYQDPKYSKTNLRFVSQDMNDRLTGREEV